MNKGKIEFIIREIKDGVTQDMFKKINNTDRLT
jgi:hypothetical protein